MSLQWISITVNYHYILALGEGVCLFLQRNMMQNLDDLREMFRVGLGIGIHCVPLDICANFQTTNNFSDSLIPSETPKAL